MGKAGTVMARLRGIFGKMADADSGSGEKERKAEVIVGKPIDIMIAVDKNKGVSFACEGYPAITFESLIQGKEIIIGNGFVKNEGAEALPEIRIVCEFEPAIVDTGILYYQDGTFEGGFEGIFDIDDPPVNLEEYAKINKAKKGKIKFTLYFGETQLGMAECVMGIKPASEEVLKSLRAEARALRRKPSLRRRRALHPAINRQRKQPPQNPDMSGWSTGRLIPTCCTSMRITYMTSRPEEYSRRPSLISLQLRGR